MRAPPRTRGATPTAAGEPKPDLHSLSHRRERGETDWLVPPRLWTALSWMEQAPNLSSPSTCTCSRHGGRPFARRRESLVRSGDGPSSAKWLFA